MARWSGTAAGLLAAALVLGGCGAAGSTDGAPAEDDLTSVKVMTLPDVVYRLPLLIADREGYFRERGIALEQVAQPAKLTSLQALDATGSDVGVSTLPGVAGAFQVGKDVAFFCGSQRELETSLFAAAGTKLPSMEDGASAEEVFGSLSGKRIGIQTPIGSALYLLFKAALEQEEVKDAALIAVGTGQNIGMATLNNGGVDVLQATPPVTQRLIESGEAKRLMYMPRGSELYGGLWGSGFWANRTWIEENPDVARGFCEAIAQAQKFAQDDANATTTEKLIMEDVSVGAEAAALVRKESVPTFSAEIDAQSFDVTAKVLTDAGILKPTPKVDFQTLVRVP